MATPLWLERLRSTVMPRQTARLHRKPMPRVRPLLVVLEDRILPSIFTVTTTADTNNNPTADSSLPVTFRDAITAVNADLNDSPGNPDEIEFAITAASDSAGAGTGYNATTGVAAITPQSALPTLTNSAIIDGYTQPGASPNTLAIGDNAVLNIVLDGSLAGAVDGLVIGSSNSTVRGLVVDNFAAGSGINLGVSPKMRLGGNDLIVGNFIGTDITGESAATNSNGILIWSPGNIIGGAWPGDRNIISGNNSTNHADPSGTGGGFGINLGFSGTLIEGNYIGTDKSGTFALPNADGVEVSGATNTTIGGTSSGTGNVISGNNGLGIDSCNVDLVVGNLIGTTATGLFALGNGNGIALNGNNNIIGGLTAGARNIISGNYGAGIYVEVGQDNLVEGNYIGTDVNGTAALRQSQGIVINGSDNTIGGTMAAARNIISGNNTGGIQISGIAAFGNTVQGNYFGTDLSGTQVVENAGYGIAVQYGAYDNTIGGTAFGEGNLISGDTYGIFLGNGGSGPPAATNTVVQGNLIGTDYTGTVTLGISPAPRILINDSFNNTIGGTTAGAGNVISGNAGTGVYVEGGNGNAILGNSIYGNSGDSAYYGDDGQGIVLDSANPFLNANNNQAAPVLSGVSTSSSGTTISGTLQSVASKTFRVEFFANPAMDPSGYGQGQTYLGFATVSTDASGNASFTATFTAVVPAGNFISATATDLAGDTSQFCKDLVVGSFLVTNTNDSGVGSLREAIMDANTLAYSTAAKPDLIAFAIPTTDPGYNSTTGAFIIQPLSALPPITDTVVIDGYTQPGASPNTLTIGDNAVLKIALDGSLLAGPVDGLVITGGNSTVRGFVIDNFVGGAGIALTGSSNDLVVGNFIGTDPTGVSAAAYDNNIGIYTASTGNLVGGASPGARNIISGTGSVGSGTIGVNLESSGNVIQGNYIGTDKSGTFALGNGTGVYSGGLTTNNTIGGTSAGAGNVISGNLQRGIGIADSNLTLVAGNLIGTTADGLTGLGNGLEGIKISGFASGLANSNTIGGTTPWARNIISANRDVGIQIEGDVAGSGQSNLVEGNFIGTDITGTTALGHQQGLIVFGAYNTIGGASVAARNIISGNAGGAIVISGPLSGFTSATFGNAVLGNYIGLDPSGTQVVGNGGGIQVQTGAYGNVIGGTVPGSGNVIAGNGFSIFLGNDGVNPSTATQNIVQGNLIGTDYTGTVAFGNGGGAGILIYSYNNTIGGTQPGAGNLISGNYGPGVFVEGGTGNIIRGNSIHDNGGFEIGVPGGIYLDSTYNANNNQAFPVLNAASVSGGGTTISGTLQSVRNTSFAVDFYANTGLDPAGFLEGQTYLGSTTVRTDGTGAAAFTATVAAPPSGELLFAATSTNLSNGDTSEFSPPEVTPTVTVTGGSFTYDGKPHAATAVATGAGGAPVSGSFSFTYNGSSTVPLNAGTYAVVETFTSSNPVYGNATGTGTIIINTAPLTVTGNNASKVYGSPNPSFTASYAGFVNGETPSNLGGTLTFSTPATTTSPVGTYPITPGGLTSSNYGIAFVPGTLTISIVTGSIYVLDPTAGGALTLSGNASINTAGTVVVDSSAGSALTASGNATVTAAGVLVVGGVKTSGNATVTKTGTPGATGDPLAGLSAPTPPSYTGTPVAEKLSGNASATISQGLYSQITVSGNAKLTLNPGIYVIGTGGVNVSGNATLNGSGVTYIVEGGGFTVSGNAGISGSSMLIVNGGSNYPSTKISGETFGGITLSGNGSFNLNAATSGADAGILIYQARDNTRALSVSGNGLAGITGTIYAANALLTLSGNASLQNPLVVGTLNLSGNVALTQLAQGSDGAGDSMGIGNTLLAGNLNVYLNDPSGYFSADMLARIQDAINGVNALLVPYNVTIAEVSDPTQANVILDDGTTSASGDMSAGVLGCYNPTGSQIEITMIQGWHWYAGADPTQIGTNQYDFQTTVTHELGHALGLGGSTSAISPMNETLPAGTARRSMTAPDLNIPEPPDGADPLTAAGVQFVSLSNPGPVSPRGLSLVENPVISLKSFLTLDLTGGLPLATPWGPYLAWAAAVRPSLATPTLGWQAPTPAAETSSRPILAPPSPNQSWPLTAPTIPENDNAGSSTEDTAPYPAFLDMLFVTGAEGGQADLFALGDQSTDRATMPALSAVDDVFALMADDGQDGGDD